MVHGSMHNPWPLLVADHTTAVELNLRFGEESRLNGVVCLNISWARHPLHNQVLRLTVGANLLVAPHLEVSVGQHLNHSACQTPNQLSSPTGRALAVIGLT